ncbi:MAG: agmatinase [Thermoproteota archaeon]
MSSLDAYIMRTPSRFFDLENDVESSRVVLLGFPYDSTSSFRVGSRFAPHSVRMYSTAIEGYSWELDREIGEAKLADAGDLITVYGDTKETLRRLIQVVADFNVKDKKVGVVGGEHTLTLASVKGCSPRSIVVFDAHLDFRDEYPYGQKLSHATWLRRCYDENAAEKIFPIGIRAVSKEEIGAAKEAGLSFLTFKQCREGKLKAVGDFLSVVSEPLYVSVDIDVLDPSTAPGVSNPEPLGFSLSELLDILWLLKGRKISGFDVVEVCPPYDNGSTCVAACKVLMDLSLLSLD